MGGEEKQSKLSEEQKRKRLRKREENIYIYYWVLILSEYICCVKCQYGWRIGMDLEGSMIGLIQSSSRRAPSVTWRATDNVWGRGLDVKPLPPTYQTFIATLFPLVSILFLTFWFINMEVNIHLFFNLYNRRYSVRGIVTILTAVHSWVR